MAGFTDLKYEAMFGRLRLAHDGNGNVYIMTGLDIDESEATDDDEVVVFSAPYEYAVNNRILYNQYMDECELNDKELTWAVEIKDLANTLCYPGDDTVDSLETSI